MPARAGTHRRPTGLQPLRPHTGQARKWVVRTVWVLVALAISATHGTAAGAGPAEVGALVSALCLWAGMRTRLPTSLVVMVQTVVTLALVLTSVVLWQGHQPVGMALVALSIAVGVLWWVREDQIRRASIAQESWRRAVLHRLEGLETRAAAVPPTSAVIAPLPSLPESLMASVPEPRRHVRHTHGTADRRRGAHASRRAARRWGTMWSADGRAVDNPPPDWDNPPPDWADPRHDGGPPAPQVTRSAS